jgi:TctA family transporter
MLISRGDLLVFVERPISAFFVTLSALLILAQIFVRMRGSGKPEIIPRAAE